VNVQLPSSITVKMFIHNFNSWRPYFIWYRNSRP